MTDRVDTVSRVIAARRANPVLRATVIAEMVGVSPARASKILRDAGLVRQTVAEQRRMRRTEKAERRASAALASPAEFACIARSLDVPLERLARLIGRDVATVKRYCAGKPAPRHTMALMHLALALGPDRMNELAHKGRTIAAGLIAKDQAKNLADPC